MRFLSDGPKEFVEYACNVAVLVDNVEHGDLVPGVTICFTDFVWILYKFTRRHKHRVAMEGKIVASTDGNRHYLVLTGVRDADLRNSGHPRYLPAKQRGQWSCILEDALNYGISDEEITQLRHNLNLFAKDGVSDVEFFQPARDVSA